MTSDRQLYRNIVNNQTNAIHSIRMFATATVIKWSDTDKKALVMLHPEEMECWCRCLQPMYSKTNGITTSPVKGALCLVAFVSKKEDEHEDAIILGYLQDPKNKLTKESNGIKDPNYTSITQANGSKIDLYTDDDTKKRLLIKGFNFVNCEAVDKINIVAPKVSLGEADLTADSDTLLKQPHLAIFNDFTSAIASFITDLITQPTLGDMGIPLPLAVRNPATLSHQIQIALKTTIEGQLKDTLNHTNKVRAK